jgi:hypothetical protein
VTLDHVDSCDGRIDRIRVFSPCRVNNRIPRMAEKVSCLFTF